MANRIQAIGAYRPRLRLGRTVPRAQLIHYLMGRTGLTEGQLSLVLTELRDAVAFFNSSGHGVKLEGLGTYFPTISMQGVLVVRHRPDTYLKRKLNAPRGYTGDILNRQHIGLTPEDLVARWNEEHPEDPIDP